MEQYTKLTVKDSYVILDLQNGGKIMKLVLCGVTVIDSKTEGNFTSSGSFLMYPWVNRVQQSQKYLFKDKNGLPLHGLYASLSRQKEIQSIKQQEAVLKIAAQVYDLQFPKFMETFTLTQNKLSVRFELTQPIVLSPVCFGYHPYIQLGEEKLINTKFQTDINTQIVLQQSLLPKYPFQTKNTVITPGQKYDSLFNPGSFFKIIGNTHSVEVSSNMPYWQIYTPNEYCIAIQPMSFCGNIYNIYKDQDYSLLQTDGTMNIQLKKL